ncbi:uncharacterized protein LOC143036811 isoform X2 [Oratosquilla oratoria]|uniref:uncharacterized protein LOC143036811 isoform X2 n=1 Tax=Oratosquilla oratoria TaxID=337810 RepID=UPI003F7628FE
MALLSGMMGEQQFCLRWNNHGSTLVAVFDSLLTSESLVDVTLAAEGHLLKAHKVVLSACSPYFQTLFAQHMDKHPIVILKDVKYADMKALLDYMYRGEVNVSQDQLGPLIKTAESLKIKGLADGTNRQESDKGPIPKPSQSVPRSLPNDNVSDVKPRPPPPDSFPSVASSVSSVLSSALTMPSSVLSNALTMPSPLSLQSPLSLPPMGSVSEHESTGPPHPKRLKKMRRRSGEPDSGDSDGPASSPNESSGGTSMHLPKIPATITPIPGQQPLPSVGPAPDLRPLSGEESHPADKESPLALRTSVCGSSSSDKESSSPSKIVKLEGSENSRDTNHLSDDEHDEKSSSHGGNDDHSTDNFAQPSTSRPLDESNQHSSGFLGWPYAGTDGSGMEEPSYGSLTENSSQGQGHGGNPVPPPTWLAGAPPPPDPLQVGGAPVWECGGGVGGGGAAGGGGGDSGGSGAGPFAAHLLQDHLDHDPAATAAVAAAAQGLALPPLVTVQECNIKVEPPSFAFQTPLPPSGSQQQILRRQEPNKATVATCERCSRSYTCLSTYKRHVRFECGVEKQFECPFCCARFAHNYMLKRHMQGVHKVNLC